MNALPVIVRELRAEARSPLTFSLRLTGAAILLGLLAFLWLTTSFSPNAGDRLFAQLHVALFLAIWLLVPLLAADCISRERRENTLGLLFLTPLHGLDIVVAKGLVHGLRALMFWLAVLPVLAVPLLLGGVSWVTALVSVLVNFSAICWALAAGLLASSLSKARTQAVALASLLSASFFLLFGYFNGLSLFGTVAGGWGVYWVEQLVRGLALAAQLVVDWSYFQRVPPGAGRGFSSGVLLLVTGKGAVLSALVLALALLVAGRAVRHGWQGEPPSAAWRWFQKVFLTPFIWRAFFDRWIRRKLESNPIGWLEQRRWTGRTAIAAWLAVIISLYLVMLEDVGLYRRYSTEIQSAMAWMLALSLAVSAAGSFRRERELGVMELLLVTPLTERDIAWGRLRGLWEQFLPAIGLLLSVWLYIAFTFGNESDWVRITFAATSFLVVPVAGLYFSLKRPGLIGALAGTIWGGLLLPLLLTVAWFFGQSLRGGMPFHYGPGLWLAAAALQVGVAALYWRRLQQALARREFPLEVQ